MAKEMPDSITRGNVLLVGAGLLFLGAIGYEGFRLIGFEGPSAGIASEAVLIFIVIAWTSSYLLRVVTGKMTFNEQRKRYQMAYEEIKTKELQDSFDAMSEEEQVRLINQIENRNDSST